MDYGARVTASGQGLPGLENTTASKEYEIGKEISILNERIEQISMVISELTDRIAPILSPMPPQNVGTGKDLAPCHTALGKMLYDFNSKIYFCTEQLKDIKNRVEL